MSGDISLNKHCCKAEEMEEENIYNSKSSVPSLVYKYYKKRTKKNRK